MPPSGRLREDFSGQAADRRLGPFGALTLAHPHLVGAREALLSALGSCDGNTIVFVVGPTGVGKTTLRLKIEHDLIAALKEQLLQDKEQIPVVSVEASAPDTGIFSWREHFRRLLDAMREPLIDWAVLQTAVKRAQRLLGTD